MKIVLILGALLLSHMSFAMGSDLCSAPELKKAVKKIIDCKVEPILYRENGETKDAELAIVITKSVLHYDVMEQTAADFVQVSGGKLIALGDFSPLRRMGYTAIYGQLEYKVGLSGFPINNGQGLFYDRRVFEKEADQYCVLYEMKPPFVGQLRDCERSEKPVGKVAYMPGVITAKQAGKLVCDFVATEVSQLCDSTGVKIAFNAMLRDKDGRVYYNVVSRHPINLSTAVTSKDGMLLNYEERTYRLNSDDGGVQLLHKSIKN